MLEQRQDNKLVHIYVWAKGFTQKKKNIVSGNCHKFIMMMILIIFSFLFTDKVVTGISIGGSIFIILHTPT